MAATCRERTLVRCGPVICFCVEFVGAIGCDFQHPYAGIDRKLPGPNCLGIEINLYKTPAFSAEGRSGKTSHAR